MNTVRFGRMVSLGGKTYVPVEADVPEGGAISVTARTTSGQPVPAKVLSPWGHKELVVVVPALLATVKVSLVVRDAVGKTAAHNHVTVRPSLAFLSSTFAKSSEDVRELWYAGIDDAPCGSPTCGSTYLELERLYTDHKETDVLHGTIEFLGTNRLALNRLFTSKLIDIYGRPIEDAAELVVMRDSIKALDDGVYLREVRFSQMISRKVRSFTLWVRHPDHRVPDGFLSLDANALAWHRKLDEGRKDARPDGVGYHDWYVHNGQASALELTLERGERLDPAPRVSLLIDLSEHDPVGLEETIVSLQNQTYGAWELVGYGDVGPSGVHRWQGPRWGSDGSAASAVSTQSVAISETDTATPPQNAPASGTSDASPAPLPSQLPPASAAEALSRAQGELVGLVSVSDVLEPNALFELVKALDEHPQALMAFGDQDLRAPGDAGRAYYLQGVLKTAFDRDALYSLGATGRPALIQTPAPKSVDLTAQDTPGLALDLALALAAVEAAQERGVTSLEEAIWHVPQVLYHVHQREGYWTGREIVPEYGSVEANACREVLAAHLDRIGMSASVEDDVVSWVGRTVDYELKAEGHSQEQPLISIVIPNKDSVEVLRRCLESIAKTSTYSNYEVIVVENNSTDPATFAYYDELTQGQSALSSEAAEHSSSSDPTSQNASSQEAADSAATNSATSKPLGLPQPPRIKNLRVIRYEGTFNFSAICNQGAAEAKGDYLLFLNNDTEVVEPRWLELLAGPLTRADVGAVGARLLYPDKLLQHGGVIIQAEGPLHVELFVPPTYDAYLGLSRYHTHQMSAVTGACLMTRREVFTAVGGFDESLPIAYNDVEFCVQVRKRGLGVVMEPRATLFHYESYSRGLDYDDTAKEIRLVSEIGETMLRWTDLYAAGDPFYDHRYAYHNNYYTLGWSPSLHAVED